MIQTNNTGRFSFNESYAVDNNATFWLAFSHIGVVNYLSPIEAFHDQNQNVIKVLSELIMKSR